MPERQAGSPATPASRPGGDVLARIVASKREEVRALEARASELRARARSAPPPRDLLGALTAAPDVSLIAEVKRRSPGAGEIRPDLGPLELARWYEEAGAAAVSVLTDAPYFGGSLSDLSEVREGIRIPVLRKDFTIVEDQVWEARAAGADAILLIVRILEDRALEELREVAEELGMTALVEAHDGEELDRALASGARLIGINNRDLGTFTTRIETTLALVERVPRDRVLVSESGIATGDQVARLAEAGVDAILVGESLLRAGDPRAKARDLLGRHRREGPRPAAGAAAS